MAVFLYVKLPIPYMHKFLYAVIYGNLYETYGSLIRILHCLYKNSIVNLYEYSM